MLQIAWRQKAIFWRWESPNVGQNLGRVNNVRSQNQRRRLLESTMIAGDVTP